MHLEPKTIEAPSGRTRFEWLSQCWLIGGLLITSLLLAKAGAQWSSGKPPGDNSLEAISAARYATKNIEDIRVGDRVVTDVTDRVRELALRDAEDRPWWDSEEVDPATWRRMELSAPLSDTDRVDVVLLRPLQWIEQVGAAVGRTINLTLPEQGIDGPARVESVDRCPAIKPGRGRVVTGTFTHVRGGILDLYLASLPTPLGVTENHPLYCVSRRAFVPAGNLQTGDVLQHHGGSTAVENIRIRRDEERVFNIEVHGDHVYRVSAVGVLVHNQSASASIREGDTVRRAFGGDADLYGRSWTRDTISEGSRDSLGLPDKNSGELVAKGRIKNIDDVETQRADPLDGNKGGGDEVIIPEARTKVEIDAVTMPDKPI